MQIRRILFEFKNIRYIRLLSIVLIVAGLVSSDAFALDPMGPATTDLREGEFNIGVDYSKSTMDIELNHGRYTEWLNGAFHEAGEAQTFEVKDFEMNKIYANLGFGILDNCELFVRLGGVNTEFGDSIWEAGEEFDSQTNFSFCIGSRATFYEDGYLTIGRLIQISWANMDGDLKSPHWVEADPIDLDLMEILISVGPTYSLDDGFWIYGGPFLHIVDGDITDTFSETDEKGLLSSKYSWDIDETSKFGGYIGAQWEIAERTFFNIEYQYTSGANSVGLSLNCRY